MGHNSIGVNTSMTSAFRIVSEQAADLCDSTGMGERLLVRTLRPLGPGMKTWVLLWLVEPWAGNEAMIERDEEKLGDMSPYAYLRTHGR